MNEPSAPAPVAGHVERLLARWEASRDAGRELAVEELCQDAPQLLPELRRRIAALQSLDWLDQPSGPPAGTHTTLFPATTGGFEGSIPLLLAGRYKLESLIAEGGFGQVWRATDTTLERAVAVKLSTLPCLAEARRVARLKHHGIVSVHDAGSESEFCFIVFDLIEGIDLADWIRRERPPWRRAVEIVAEVAGYVHYAHTQGFVHRDIKPANILLTREGNPVLADFGIAMTQAELEEQRSTTVGTVAYMAPEQLLAAGRIDARTDVYGLGVVLYELLTGAAPFAAETLWGLREKILQGNFDPPRKRVPDLPPELDRLCVQCLASDPAARLATAQALADALRALL